MQLRIALLSLGCAMFVNTLSAATMFSFSTGSPDGLMATASRPDIGASEIESADDFVLSTGASITSATFQGILTNGATLSDIGEVVTEIYRVFPLDSTDPPSGRVPTRVNSPSDVAFQVTDSATGTLSFSPTVLNPSFTVANSVQPGGIHPIPNQTTGGDGPVTGTQVLFNITFNTPFLLPPGHYFFVPQVQVANGEFLWLSAPKPIVGGTPFLPDLQSWTRDAALDPDWLRIGTDIVGGATPPTFNATFSLTGTSVPEPATMTLVAGALAGLMLRRRFSR